MDGWVEAQRGEAEWWGDCVNTYQEETKQRDMFAPRLGLREVHSSAAVARGRWPVYDLTSRSVVDIGCGPTSILLKCVRIGSGSAVCDPCPYPSWVWSRYIAAGLEPRRLCGEDLTGGPWDEAWIYNVLQHVIDPEEVVRRARSLARIVRLVEWIDHGTDDKHPHSLSMADLNRWLGRRGSLEAVPRADGLLYSGSSLPGPHSSVSYG